jgi:ATP-dependent DNA ligase
VWILEAALKNRQKQFIIDGEAVILGIDGIPDFNALHSRRQDDEVQLYAFDIMALDGEDLRQLPLSLRKTNLARLLARAAPMASSSHPMSRARLVRTCFVACPVARARDRSPAPYSAAEVAGDDWPG